MSLEQVSPQLDFWSHASDVGWGAHLGEEVTSDLWAPEEVELSINVRELSCGSLLSSVVHPWQSSPTTPRPLRTSGTREAHILLFSTP